jgi:peptidoglycan hydrolase CwlO-like protein
MGEVLSSLMVSALSQASGVSSASLSPAGAAAASIPASTQADTPDLSSVALTEEDRVKAFELQKLKEDVEKRRQAAEDEERRVKANEEEIRKLKQQLEETGGDIKRRQTEAPPVAQKEGYASRSTRHCLAC